MISAMVVTAGSSPPSGYWNFTQLSLMPVLHPFVIRGSAVSAEHVSRFISP